MKFFFIRHIKYSTKNKNLCQIFLSISLVSLTFICAGNPPQRSSMIACVLVNVHSFLIGPPRYHNVLYFFCSKLYIFFSGHNSGIHSVMWLITKTIC